MNAKLMKSEIVKHGDTQTDLAKYLGISVSNLNEKIHGKSTSFRQNEISAIKERYNLSADDVDCIFFASQLS